MANGISDLEVVVLSRVTAKVESMAAVRRAYSRSLSSELRDAGCTRYECYQDVHQENALLALGVWKSLDHFEQHLAGARIEIESINELLLRPPEMRVLSSTSRGHDPRMLKPS